MSSGREKLELAYERICADEERFRGKPGYPAWQKAKAIALDRLTAAQEREAREAKAKVSPLVAANLSLKPPPLKRRRVTPVPPKKQEPSGKTRGFRSRHSQNY